MFNNSRNFQVLGGNYYVVKGDLNYNFNVPSKEFVGGVTGDSDGLDSVIGLNEKDTRQSIQEQESTGEVPTNCSSSDEKHANMSIGDASNVDMKNGPGGDSMEDTGGTKCTHTIYADAGEKTETIRVGGTVNLRISGAKEIRVGTSGGRIVTIILDP